MSDPITDVKSGSLRWRDGTGRVFVSQPGDRLYSTAQFLATEWFDGQEWIPYGEPKHWQSEQRPC
mgnify:CR=1 FL=1